jgi:hypothetical protein
VLAIGWVGRISSIIEVVSDHNFLFKYVAQSLLTHIEVHPSLLLFNYLLNHVPLH